MQGFVIVASNRTAVGKFGGTLDRTPATELSAAVILEFLARADFRGEQIDDAVLGQVLQAGCGLTGRSKVRSRTACRTQWRP